MSIHIIMLSIWVICGFIAYGTAKGISRNAARENVWSKHDSYNEVLCWIVGIFGVAGLVSIILIWIVSYDYWKIGFCLKMPKELRRKNYW